MNNDPPEVIKLVNSAIAVTVDPWLLLKHLAKRGADNHVTLTARDASEVYSGVMLRLEWVDVYGKRQAVESDTLHHLLLEASALDFKLFRQKADKAAYLPPGLLADGDGDDDEGEDVARQVSLF
jgi:hypothetical protein